MQQKTSSNLKSRNLLIVENGVAFDDVAIGYNQEFFVF